MKRTLVEILEQEMQKKAAIMCERYCKYGELVRNESEENDEWRKYCSKCPMEEFYVN